MLAEYYPLLKSVHVAAVVVSVLLLVARSLLGLTPSAVPLPRALRIAPHVVDTALLASAVALTLILHQYPFVDGWLTAKVLALCLYIVIGSVAVKRGRTPRIRLPALLLALLVVGYIAATALHHDPRPWGW